MSQNRLAKSGNPRLDGGSASGSGENRQPLDAEFQQVLRRDIAGAAVVDAHQVVRRSAGIRHDAAVEQDDRDVGAFQAIHDCQIGIAGSVAGLQGAKKTPLTLRRDKLIAEFQGLVRSRSECGRGIAPQQRVTDRLRRGGDAAADRFEDLGAAEVGDQQPEEQAVSGRRGPPNVSAGARDALDQAAMRQFP